jgi:MFS family permease
VREIRSVWSGWYAVVVLGGLYVVAGVDRLILNLMVEPLRHDLHINDTQISLLMGAAFAVFYSVVGLPLGRVADIGNRKWLVVSAAVVWGACTLGSGLAGTFWLLCSLRIGVAIGEAALTPASLSLICDLFPPERRAHASSVYMAFGAAGATGAYILGGMAVNAAAGLPRIVLPLTGLVRPWQAVFLAVGAPALLLAALVALTVKEPQRDAAPASPGLTFAWIRKPYAPVFLMFVAAAIGQVIVYGLGGWAPTYLVRRFHWAAGDAGISIGLISMVMGVSGMLLAPRIAEAWSARGRPDAPNLVLAGGLMLGFPLVVAAALAPSAVGFLAFFGAGMIFIMGTGVMPFICVQWAVPSRLRGEMLAAGLLGNALTGIALGPTAVVLAARLLPGDQASHLGGGIAVVAAVCGPLAAACVLALRKPMARLIAAKGDEAALSPAQPPAASLAAGAL